MRVVRSEDELEGAYAAASAEAEAAFGDGSLYLEKVLSPARHVEIQVLADGWGLLEKAQDFIEKARDRGMKVVEA